MSPARRLVAIVVCLSGALLTVSCAQEGVTSSASADAPETFVVEEAAVSFELPSGWDEFDADTMQEALEDNAVMDEFSDRSGMTSDQMQQLISSNISLFVVAPEGDKGMLGNVNVLVFDGEALPTSGALQMQYRTMGAAHIVSDDVSTPVGDGFATTYQLDLPGTTAYGASIALDVAGDALVVTITTADETLTGDLADQVLDSLVAA